MPHPPLFVLILLGVMLAVGVWVTLIETTVLRPHATGGQRRGAAKSRGRKRSD